MGDGSNCPAPSRGAADAAAGRARSQASASAPPGDAPKREVASPEVASPEALLRGDTALCTRVLDSMRDGVQVVDAEGVIVWVNRRFCALFGYEADDLIGAHVSLLNAPTARSPEEVAEHILAALARDGVWHGELPNLRSDGTVIWTTATVTTYDHPTLGRLSITVQGSIDARRAAEDSLRRYAETLDAVHRIQSRVIRQPRSWPFADLLETLAAAVSLDRAAIVESVGPGEEVTDDGDDGRISTWAYAGLRALARHVDPRRADGPATRWPAAHAIRAVIERGRRGALTVEVGPRTEHWLLLPLVSAGVGVGALCIGRDSDELPPGGERLVDLIASTAGNMVAARRIQVERRRVAAERALLGEQMRHAQTLSAVGTLAGGVAHDFNNILQGISLTNEMIELDRDTPELVADGTDDVRRLTQRGGQLVRDLLLFSRPRDAAFAPLDLGEAFDGALRILRASLPRAITLETRLEGLVGELIVGSGAQLEQVLVNLGTNAAHAIGDARGRITISGAVEPTPDPMRRAGYQGGSAVRIDVRDDGCGMDAATLTRVFEPFFTTKDPGKGTGLGLAMVRRIVEAHGGLVEAFSRPGEGCRMTLWLPRAPAAETRYTPPMHSVGAPASVLLVDDERDIARRLAGALERLGYTVEAHLDPQAAERAFASQPQVYDLLLTDQSMPSMSGEALVERLRAVRPDLPAIMFSGRGALSETEAAAGRGVDRVIAKPVDLARLTRVIVEVLEERGSMRDPARGD